MALDPKNKKQIEDIIGVLDDGINSIVSAFSTNVKKALTDIDDDISKNIAKDLSRGITNEFRSVVRLTDKLADNQFAMERGRLKSKAVEKDIEKIHISKLRTELKFAELQRTLTDDKIKAEKAGDIATATALEKRLTDAETDKDNFEAAAEERKKELNEQLSVTKEIEASTGALGEIFTRLSKNNFFGSLFNAEESVEAMKAKAAKLKGEGKLGGIGSQFKIGGEGIKTIFKGLGKALFTLTAISSVFKMILDFFVRGDRLATSVAKNLGVSKEQAAALALELRDANIEIGESNFNLEQMINAQKTLVETQGVLTASSFGQAEAMATITERLGISGDNAAMLLTYMQANGEQFESVFNSVQSTATAINQVNENGVNAQMIFKEVAESSATILANFGFSFQELTKAVSTTRRLGVSLTQAKNVAEGLLDFEQSIGAELEAEILLGRQFNFERARALAATGDIAGATQEVLKQTQNLNDEQLRSPIIQQAIAKATGLTTEEFLKARKIQQMLANDSGELTKLLNDTTDAKKRALIEQGILAGSNIKQIKESISVQEKFNNAIQNVKDQFQNLATSGGLEKVFQYFTDVAKALGEGKNFFSLFGDSAFDVASDKMKERNQVSTFEDHLKAKYAKNTTQSEAVKSARVNLNDFTIRANPKDTLVMAGGTKFGDETNKLLKSMLGEMKKSTVLNIDSSNVVQKAIETTYK